MQSRSYANVEVGASTPFSRFLTAILVGAAILGQTALAAYKPGSENPPKVLQEFRGAWVATVANIDWPSRRDLPVAEQKRELLEIMDRAGRLKLNAIIFQVRPACDALYASDLEPWSEYLTGTMGKAPEPFYDPLDFAIKEAHARGLELHAWFNPYRARHLSAKSPISPRHISRTRPHLVKQYGNFLWLDPAEKEVQDYSLEVVMDVLQRYDVDGIHFDDYFYPYKERGSDGKDLDFPDDTSWKKYKGKLSRDDWRRENVNAFIERTYRSIKHTKPWVKFGVSPFGIWRPGNPSTIEGHDAYAKLYADSKKWLNKGWVDYFAPQLYWQISPPAQSYPVLLKWWAAQNSYHRHLYPGLNTANARAGRNGWTTQEIDRQIGLTRKQKGTSGHIHWNMSALTRGNFAEVLRDTYAQIAIPPAATWLDKVAPAKPSLTAAVEGRDLRMGWRPGDAETPALWVLQTRVGKTWTTQVLPGSRLSRTGTGPMPDAVAVSAVDRCGNVGRPVVVVKEVSTVSTGGRVVKSSRP